MAIIKKCTNNNVGENVEKTEPSYTVGNNVSWHSHNGKQDGGSLENSTFRNLRSRYPIPSLHGKQMGAKWKQWQISFS